MGAFIDLTGKRFGKLVAVRPVRRGRSIHWVCVCDCGGVSEPNGSTLRGGTATSCGCSRKTDEFRARCAEVHHRHGYFGTPEYQAWNRIVDVCENPSSNNWHNYGGRGIRMDKAWRDDPSKFIRDMGPRPSTRHSVERKDVNGPYAPWNCVWATPDVQGNNKRTNVFLTFEGRTQTVAQWAREIGVSRTTLADRLMTRSVEDALRFTPKKQGRLIEFEGQTKPVTEWADILGFSRRGLGKRLKTMSIEEAFTKPKRVWPNADNQ